MEVRSEDDWDRKYDMLVSFVAEHKRQPTTYEKVDGIPLGQWCRLMMRWCTNGKLPLIQEEKILSVPSLRWPRYGRKLWMEYYAILKQYVAEFNTIPPRKCKYKNCSIGTWVQNQRATRSANRLKPNKEKLLNAVDRWYWSNSRPYWSNWYDLLLQYVAEYHKIPTADEKFKDRAIGRWTRDQRFLFKANKMPALHIQQLEKVENWTWTKPHVRKMDILSSVST